VLAFDFKLVIFMAFIAISIISWIIKQVNENQRPQPAPRRPQAAPRPRNDRIQQEIDQFLKEAAQRRAPPGRGDVLDADDIEIVSAPARRPPPMRRAPPAPRPQRQPQAAPAAPRRPGEELAGRHLTASSGLGPQPAASSRQRMDERLAAQASQHLPHAVDHAVSQHLGVFAADTSSAAGGGSRSTGRIPAAALLQALRSPGGVQQAVMMQEILQRPRALRR
jgi:hypothetical protein